MLDGRKGSVRQAEAERERERETWTEDRKGNRDWCDNSWRTAWRAVKSGGKKLNVWADVNYKGGDADEMRFWHEELTKSTHSAAHYSYSILPITSKRKGNTREFRVGRGQMGNKKGKWMVTVLGRKRGQVRNCWEKSKWIGQSTRNIRRVLRKRNRYESRVYYKFSWGICNTETFIKPGELIQSHDSWPYIINLAR